MTLKRYLEDGRLSCWATPVAARHWLGSESFDRALCEAILARRNSYPGVGTSVVGGWQSKADLLYWPEPEIPMLRDRISEVTRVLHDVVTAALPVAPAWDLVAEAWGVVHDEGNFHDMHSHPGSVWSGVYYVAVPEGPGAGGTLELLDPRPMARALANGKESWIQLEPRQSYMVVFPSWVSHRVAPVRRPGPRICVAFNVGNPRGGAQRG